MHLWGRLDLAERLELVRGLGGGGVERLAGGLVAGGLLGDAITTLLAFTPTPGDVVMVVALLHALTQAKRSVCLWAVLFCKLFYASVCAYIYLIVYSPFHISCENMYM